MGSNRATEQDPVARRENKQTQVLKKRRVTLRTCVLGHTDWLPLACAGPLKFKHFVLDEPL